MMITRYLFSIAFFSLIACTASEEKSAYPNQVDLVIVDSLMVEENSFFTNSLHHVKMIGDSLIAISSIRTPAISIIQISGKQIAQIASKDFPIAPFLPSSFDVSEYPKLYILDKRSESILIFDAQRQQFLDKVKLNIPSDKRIKLAGSKFLKNSDGYIIELESAIYDNYHPDYFRKSGDQVFFFNEDGVVIDSFLEFPKELKEVNGSLSPIEYLVSAKYDQSLILSFPQEQIIRRYNQSNPFKLIEEIPLPPSNIFDYSPKSSETIISFQEIFESGKGLDIAVPRSHYFNTIYENKNFIIITTWMSNNEEAPNNKILSHLFTFDKINYEWFETSNPKNILDIGKFVGVVNDTLYFYEGSLMKHDEKYIKRAILKPIEE
ncbi:hypothetical protein [Algoriphagus pacificus]|uniref:TolB-like 6-blade propeller-like n=1 Tax=Algoriphagus pacificus TaxID=2811234 RepID=A0ABS3CCX3_9BACT|nr:hypothetical protein [Algoriphagus pacificus]MBN7814847.1 hypothetical protein [Algoriphagus pacificus]